jgi:hypothetical protein
MLVILGLAIGGCGLVLSSYDEKPYGEINVSSSSTIGRYALPIRYHITRRGGNVHDFNDLSKYEEDRTEWLYLDSLSGKISANAIVYKLFAGDKMTRPIQGYIEISDNLVKINLEMPVYENGKATDKWTNYKFNGTYRMNRAPNNSLNTGDSHRLAWR